MAHFLFLLGETRLETGEGEPLDFPVGKPLALLSYLTVEGRRVGRDELSELLWPDSPPDRARHSVRQALWLIRRKLGEDVVQGEDPVFVSPDALSLDLRELEEALQGGDLEKGMSLWKGPLLANLRIPECRVWEHWREEQRELAVHRFFQALLGEARALLDQGKSGEALPYLAKAVELNPHSLEARSLQVEAHLLLREISAARRALEEARRESSGDVGGEGVLDQLAQRVRDNQPRSIGEAPDRLGESLELVGRRQELGDLHGLWKRVLSGRMSVACILGPTGIGKTRICEEFLAGVEVGEGVVARARGFRGEHRIPWGVVADLVRQLMTLPGAMGIGTGSEAVIRAMLPSMSRLARGEEQVRDEGGNEVGGPGLTPTALADAVLDMVEAIGFEGPLVIFIDDWQWVDKESRALLGKVMRRVLALPCLFLLAERTGERRARQEKAEDLTREFGGRVIVLEPLTHQELRQLLGLLAEFSRTEGVDEVVGRIHGVTRGNPLFVGEVIRKLAEEGVYRWQGGRWILSVESFPEVLDLPDSVQELIQKRLERLGPSGAQLAAALARERRSVPVASLRKRSGLDEAVFTRAMGELLDREVIEWVGAREVDFTHDQFREGARRFYRSPGGQRLSVWLRERPGRGVLVALAAVLIFILGGIGGARLISSHEVVEGPALLDPPFGEGRLIILGDSIRALAPPRYQGEGWRVVSTDLQRPANAVSRIDGPYRTPGGEIRWFGEYYGVEEPPHLVEYLEDGRDTLVFQGPGDDGFLDLGPDGESLLITTEDTASPRYRRDLVLLTPGTAPDRVLYRGAEMVGWTDWSRDGTRMIAQLHGVVDTMVALTPLGEELDRWTVPGFRGARRPQWCGGSRYVVLSAVGPEPARVFRLDTRSGEFIRLGEGFLATQWPLCLGVDWAVAYVGIGEEERAVYVEDLNTGAVVPVLDVPESEAVSLRWLPDRMPPPVWEVEIPGGGRTLEWSRQDTLAAAVRRSDGSPAEAELVWESSDAGVASVNPEGVLTANGVGSAFITVEAAGWIRDSISVVVEEARVLPDEVLFRETFQDGLEAWLVPDSTFPDPEIVRHRGRRVLSLPGDGRYRDFLESMEVFSLQYGATLELEVRLPLSREDKQRWVVCLNEVRREEGGGRETYVSTGQAFCAQYPSGILSQFRDEEVVVYGAPRGVEYGVDVSRVFPTDDWVHLALQVRSDGIGSLVVDREPLFETPYMIRGHASSLWRILLEGAAVDTQLLFRDVTLWRGVRY